MLLDDAQQPGDRVSATALEKIYNDVCRCKIQPQPTCAVEVYDLGAHEVSLFVAHHTPQPGLLAARQHFINKSREIKDRLREMQRKRVTLELISAVSVDKRQAELVLQSLDHLRIKVNKMIYGAEVQRD